jgi:hypothetical protein
VPAGAARDLSGVPVTGAGGVDEAATAALRRSGPASGPAGG